MTMAICTVLKAAEVIQPLVGGGSHIFKDTSYIKHFMSVTLDFVSNFHFCVGLFVATGFHTTFPSDAV